MVSGANGIKGSEESGMTVYSRAYQFELKGEPAELRVVRNQGFCWGEVSTLPESRTLKVSDFQITTHKDQYDESDDDAAAAFIKVAKKALGDNS